MAYSFDEGTAPDRHEVQYFEMFGNRGIYYKGWERGDQAPHTLADGRPEDGGL